MRQLETRAISLPKRLPLALLLAITAAGCYGQGTEAHLADYRALVVFIGAEDATVTATVRLAPRAAPQQLLIASYAGEHVTGIAARRAQSAIAFTIANLAGALDIHLSPDEHTSSGETVEIQYSIHSAGRLLRVPLPLVNALPLPEQRPVMIEATLPAGMVAIGEGFPQLTWRDPHHGEARLPAVPSVLALETRKAGSVSWLDRFLTPAAVSTITMLALLLTGSIVWYTCGQSRAASRIGH